MRCHEARLYRDEFAPRAFCASIRLPDRSPEGVVAIETSLSDGAEPVHTLTRSLPPEMCNPMTLPLDAATRVTFGGERHLHAYLAHDFGGAGVRRGGLGSALRPRRGHDRTAISARRDVCPVGLTLTVRARQFSCFTLLLGRLGPGSTFEPSHAMIVRNKDDLRIPLILEQLPAAKEFRDAIASLSPEQQRFAKAYRAMQLAGSAFGLLVVQLKPQLERLLRLPADGLTKEIRLTQQLLELFIEYQIPSDLLTYDGPAEAPTSEKLAAVRGHVAAIFEAIDASKKAEIDAARQRHEYHQPFAQANSSLPPGKGGALFGGRGGGKGGSCPRMMQACASSCKRSSPEVLDEAAAPAPTSLFSMPASASASAEGSMEAPAAAPLPPPAPPPPPPKVPSDVATRVQQWDAAAPVPLGPPRTPSSGNNPPDGNDPPDMWLPKPTQPAEVAESRRSSKSERGESTASSEAPTGPGPAASAVELEKMPGVLDAKIEAHDIDAALRPTKISVGPLWLKREQVGLLEKPSTRRLTESDQTTERQRAFDLLDALSRAGSLPIECASLHVMVAATHCFDLSLMETVVARNTNPIEKLEHSSLLLAEVVHATPAASLVRPEAFERVKAFAAPQLLGGMSV